ncbi:DnaJ family domain-containing protein [Microbacterium sp.]|uniref:DnaJ family domain-containing protein n=1 Tax=Microbacterium sp. TaxID=51671 RepID=UPI0033424E09
MPDPEDAREAEAAEQRSAPSVLNAQNKAEIVEAAIQVAIRRGEFDDLPGAGKPIEGLGTHHDPDWWIRRKIETENLTGLGPPAIMLRNEDRTLERELDRLPREEDVREALEDFNRRVVDARRQLLGGPPVVTRTRDVDAEVRAWRERRRGPAAPDAAGTEPEPSDAPSEERRRWWRRA